MSATWGGEPVDQDPPRWTGYAMGIVLVLLFCLALAGSIAEPTWSERAAIAKAQE